VAPAPAKPPTSETTVIKHSKSSGKLERKVSFSEADPVKIGENGHHQQPSKPKRSKEKKVKSSSSSSSNSKGHIKKPSPKDVGPKNESDFVDQVNAKLKVLEQQQRLPRPIITIWKYRPPSNLVLNPNLRGQKVNKAIQPSLPFCKI